MKLTFCFAFCFCFFVFACSFVFAETEINFSTKTLENFYLEGRPPSDIYALHLVAGRHLSSPRSFSISHHVSYRGSGVYNTSVSLGRTSLTNFGDGAQFISSLTLTQPSSSRVLVGGALQCGVNCSLFVTKVTFSFTRAVVAGGAIASIGGSVTIDSSTFISCYAPYGGAVYVFDVAAISVRRSTFTDVTAFSGPAIYATKTGVVVDQSTIRSHESEFSVPIVVFVEDVADYPISVDDSVCAESQCVMVTALDTAMIVDCQNSVGSFAGVPYCSAETNPGTLFVVCASGDYRNADGVCTTCSTCPIGTSVGESCAELTDTVCVACTPPNTIGWVFTTGCMWECDEATGYSLSGEVCVSCPVGQYLTGGVCQTCSNCSSGEYVDLVQPCRGTRDTVCSTCPSLPGNARRAHDTFSCDFMCEGDRIPNRELTQCVDIRVESSQLTGTFDLTEIDGLVNSSLIENVNADVLNGTIPTSRISGTVDAAHVTTGVIDGTLLSTVEGSKLTGSLDASMITGINTLASSLFVRDDQGSGYDVADITGTFPPSQIQGITGSKISGPVPTAQCILGVGTSCVNVDDHNITMWSLWTACADQGNGAIATRVRTVTCTAASVGRTCPPEEQGPASEERMKCIL